MGRNRTRHPYAWAPYNFVPMPNKPVYAELDAEGKPPRHDIYDAERHTGYFEVTLTTETPLFVRGMLTEAEITYHDENGARKVLPPKERSDILRKKPDFFSPDGAKPVIPGSSLRGMLRTLTEIVTNSKMHFISDNKLVYRAIFYGDALVNDYREITTDVLGDKHYAYPTERMGGGYLRRGESPSGWVIQPAKAPNGDSIALVDRKQIPNIDRLERRPLTLHNVWIIPPLQRELIVGKEGVNLRIAEARGIQMASTADRPSNDYEAATLLISKTVGSIEKNRHWYPAVYAPVDDPQQALPISQQMWDDFIKDRDLNRGIPNRRIENEDDVLFYLLDKNGNLLFFGPTMFFRVPYKNSIVDLIPQNLRASNDKIDYAEAMFGYVSERDEDRTPSAYAGRVSVTSAFLTDDSPHRDNPFDETIIPKILSSPKPTTFQHYLEQPKEAWDHEDNLHHYGVLNARLRGHKLYWRQMQTELAQVQEPKYKNDPQTAQTLQNNNDTQHTLIRPVRKGITFQFKIHFENLTKVELGALIWVLTLGDDPDARHQLGMGKPFGLGVVQLQPKLVLTSRTSADENKGRYRRLFDDKGGWFKAENPVSRDDKVTYVTAFKDAVGFDNSRIDQLQAMLRKQPANLKMFGYMQIGDDDYQRRPVLPYPTEVLGEIESEQQRQQAEEQARQEAIAEQNRANLREELQARVSQEGLKKGDVIGGELKGSKGKWISDDEFWFSPRKFYYGTEGGVFSLSSDIRNGYQAHVYISKSKVSDKDVTARIIDIDDNQSPVKLICEWIEQE